MHSDATNANFSGIVSPVTQIYCEAGVGSCKAKDLGRNADKDKWLRGILGMIRREDYQGAADAISSSKRFRKRVFSGNLLQGGLPGAGVSNSCQELLCARACLHSCHGSQVLMLRLLYFVGHKNACKFGSESHTLHAPAGRSTASMRSSPAASQNAMPRLCTRPSHATS